MPRYLIAALICVIALFAIGCESTDRKSAAKITTGINECKRFHEGVQALSDVSSDTHGQTTAFIVVCKDGYVVRVDD